MSDSEWEYDDPPYEPYNSGPDEEYKSPYASTVYGFY